MTTVASQRAAVPAHWREYLIEVGALASFMISACVVTALLEHPASPVRRAIPDALARRAIIGTAMGLTAIAIMYSPWGRRSGAHLNRSFTLTFLRLGRIARIDALGYVLAQFAGGVAGVMIASRLVGMVIADASVRYAVTVPGEHGIAAAFAAELVISFLLMTMVLHVAGSPRLAPFTGLIAGTMVMLYITFEAPLSGMSMNPARTFGSAFAARDWTAIWIYFVAPPLGMLLAASVKRRPASRVHVAPMTC